MWQAAQVFRSLGLPYLVQKPFSFTIGAGEDELDLRVLQSPMLIGLKKVIDAFIICDVADKE
jgi:hypothetical protein